MTRLFLGVDVGGTKSHALIADECGNAIGFGEGGSGNPQGVGYDGLHHVLRSIIEQAAHTAGIAIDQISGSGFGIGGYDWPSQREEMLSAIYPIGVRDPIGIVNDAIIGLLAGAEQGWGIAIVAGTGCNCWGWNRQHQIGRMAGFGYPVAEAAGASEIMEEAARAIALEWGLRGPATRLTAAFCDLYSVKDNSALLEAMTLGHLHLQSEHAPIVFRVAAAGDAVAQGIVAWAGHELGDMACGVIRQLRIEDEAFEAVLVGSLFNGGPMLIDPLRETILSLAPRAQLVRLVVPPVVGGVLLGMEQAGVDFVPLRHTLIESTRTFVNGMSTPALPT
jgi:N-acetylglucosamine kinase-like BadF-type ATPase